MGGLWAALSAPLQPGMLSRLQVSAWPSPVRARLGQGGGAAEAARGAERDEH